MMDFLPKDARKPSIDISPLVDVIFLLVIFFAVSTTFREGKGLPIALPEAGGTPIQIEGTLEITIDKEGRIAFRDQVFEDVEALRAPLEEALAASEDKRVVVGGDEDSRYGVPVKVLAMARELGAKSANLKVRVGAKDGS